MMAVHASTVMPALSVDNLSVDFSTRRGDVTAVNDVSFYVNPGEVLGVVGESGSGKSVTGLAVMGLIERPGHISAGRIVLEGQDITDLGERDMRRLRGNRIAMIFQDPISTLNPVLRIDTQIMEAITAHERVSQAAARARAIEALKAVGIPSPESRLEAYPHQFSGGMRQRVAIAIALLHRPAVLIADEPTTALDVTIQAQILGEVQRWPRRTAPRWSGLPTTSRSSLVSPTGSPSCMPAALSKAGRCRISSRRRAITILPA